MTRLAVIGAILLLLAGCGDTWDKFLTPDFSWNRDRSVSADRTPAGEAMAPQQTSRRAASPGYRPATSRTAAQSGCYRGRLTAEGNTCQAMRTDGGDLFTLAGPLRGFGPGDAVCVCGIPSAQQFCRQGLTLLIREIGDDCANIQ